MDNTCQCCGSKLSFLNPKISITKENGSYLGICAECNKHLDSLKRYSMLRAEEFYEKEKEYFIKLKTNSEESFKEYIEKIFDETETPFFEEEERIEAKKRNLDQLKSKIQSIVISNGFNVEGYNVSKYISVISSESVLGTGLFSELDASFSDFFGSESESFNVKIDSARQIATERLIRKAVDLNANAIIGLSYDYLSIKTNLMAVMVTGTAVSIVPIEIKELYKRNEPS